MRADNTAHLRAAARRRHEKARAKALDAIDELRHSGGRITFGGVADRAGISRSWLYTQPDLVEQIQRLRDIGGSTNRPSAGRTRQSTSEESWRRRIELAHARIKELTEEVAALRTQLALAHGQRRADQIVCVTDIVYDAN